MRSDPNPCTPGRNRTRDVSPLPCLTTYGRNVRGLRRYARSLCDKFKLLNRLPKTPNNLSDLGRLRLGCCVTPMWRKTRDLHPRADFSTYLVSSEAAHYSHIFHMWHHHVQSDSDSDLSGIEPEPLAEDEEVESPLPKGLPLFEKG